ncbi:MAG TPA: dienelactone hydrolase family protein [Propionibacteriaceae bacterium]|nr:dienelactone hydrolase family protein [Propionibacteriaceae bacterium]
MHTVTSDSTTGDRLTVLTRPAEPGPWPGVVMIHEAWGIDDVLRRQAERMASLGYVVLAPDLLGEGSWLRCMRRAMKAYRARSGKPFELIETCRQQLVDDPDCTGQVGVIGFCMGGGFALLSARTGFGASAINYAPVPDDVDALARDFCPMVVSYGGRDRIASSVPALTAALRNHSVPHDVEVYPNAGHCFLNDAYNGPWAMRTVLLPLVKLSHVGPEPEAAADTWRRIEAFFAEHLVPPSS